MAYYKSQKEEPAVSDTFKDWVYTKLEHGEIGRGTFDRYTNDYIRFFGGTSFEKMKVKDVTEDDLDDFIRKTIMEHKLTRKAFANCRILIFGIFKRAKKKKTTQISITWFMKDLELLNNIFTKVIHKKEDQVYKEDEMPLAVEYLKNKPTMLNLGLLLAFQSGLRCGELAALKPTDIVGRYNGGIEKMCEALNIPQKSMHKIRRTYGTTLIDEKVDGSIIMEQIGNQ